MGIETGKERGRELGKGDEGRRRGPGELEGEGGAGTETETGEFKRCLTRGAENTWFISLCRRHFPGLFGLFQREVRRST